MRNADGKNPRTFAQATQCALGCCTATMSWLHYAAPTIAEQAKVVGVLSAMLWLFQTVLLHSAVHKPDQARHSRPHTHARTHANTAL